MVAVSVSRYARNPMRQFAAVVSVFSSVSVISIPVVTVSSEYAEKQHRGAKDVVTRSVKYKEEQADC